MSMMDCNMAAEDCRIHPLACPLVAYLERASVQTELGPLLSSLPFVLGPLSRVLF